MRKCGILIMTVFTAVYLTGCGMFSSQIPDMTDEEHDMVVEYATKTLLSYDKNNGDKLKGNVVEHVFTPPIIEGTPDDIEHAGEVLVENSDSSDSNRDESIPSLNLQLPVDAGEDVLSDETIEVVDNTQDNPNGLVRPTEFSSAEELLGINGLVSVQFKEYLICDNYPESTESYFIMKASEGNKLVVLKIDLANISSQDVPIDIPGAKIRFKITLNGKTKNALNTMLLNDFVYYSETLVPNETEEVVVVGEFPEEECLNISGLSLILKGTAGSADIVLK